VVIAIIAILAAVLFPVFMTAKKSAKRSACINNLRQIGGAAALYCDSYNGYYPPTREGNWPWGAFNLPFPNYTEANPHQGPLALRPYLKNNNVFYCPSQVYYTPGSVVADGGYIGYSWWANWFSAWANPQLTQQQVAVNVGRYPRALVASDITFTCSYKSYMKWNSHDPGAEPLGSNYLYNDGHVKWKWFKEMKKLFTLIAGTNYAFRFYY
jgi:prepilin-type processing-associated H-X9-DG protein